MQECHANRSSHRPYIHLSGLAVSSEGCGVAYFVKPHFKYYSRRLFHC